MTRFRVKIISGGFIEIEPKQNESISGYISTFVFKDESICDYNILIIRLEDVDSYYAVKRLDKEELGEFFTKPSIIVCLSGKEATYDGFAKVWGQTVPETVTNYSWLPEIKGLKVLNKTGKSVYATADTGRLSNLFNACNWEWKCSFRELPSKFTSIACNLSNIPVAIKANIGEGMLFIIPTPEIDIYDFEKYPTFLRQLIDICEEEIEELGRRERKEPDWVEKQVDLLESKLLQEWFPYYERYNVLRGARKLFYETGSSLTRIVHFVVSKMGFNAEMREEEGIQDIEICEDDFNLLVEVASSEEDWINIRKTRQLLDWCQRFEREQNKKPKGILIANHFCNHVPAERDDPFTPAALKHGEGENFCLMTTEQLYKIFCKFLKDEMSKDEIKQLFLETQGLLQFEG